MKTTWRVCAVICAVIVLGIGSVALANMAVKGEDPAMMVSPQTIVLRAVTSVTVHTNIPADSVVPGSLTLNGVAPIGAWVDDCGHIAARFALADLQLVPDDVVLTLEGLLVGEPVEPFAAEETVSVK